MKITLTLSEILDQCDDWGYFCQQEGWSEWACAEGGGYIEVTLSEEKAKEYGLIE